jgi:hypothetical protein
VHVASRGFLLEHFKHSGRSEVYMQNRSVGSRCTCASDESTTTGPGDTPRLVLRACGTQGRNCGRVVSAFQRSPGSRRARRAPWYVRQARVLSAHVLYLVMHILPLTHVSTHEHFSTGFLSRDCAYSATCSSGASSSSRVVACVRPPQAVAAGAPPRRKRSVSGGHEAQALQQRGQSMDHLLHHDCSGTLVLAT